jgi:hypothetical protein
MSLSLMPRPKMAKNACRQNKNLVTSEVRQNAPGDQRFFSFGERWGCLISFVPQSVPMEFSLCSHQAPLSSKVPIAPHFILYHLH